MKATVYKSTGSWYILQNEAGEIFNARIKGKLKIDGITSTNPVAVGDVVTVEMENELENTLTIVDDLALPLSRLRVRGSGSDAGHNGLKDIQLTLGTDQYPKLRFGIGNRFPKGHQVDFVLGRWLADEVPVVQQKIDKCCEIIESFASIGLARTMNLANAMVFGEEGKN